MRNHFVGSGNNQRERSSISHRHCRKQVTQAEYRLHNMPFPMETRHDIDRELRYHVAKLDRFFLTGTNDCSASPKRDRMNTSCRLRSAKCVPVDRVSKQGHQSVEGDRTVDGNSYGKFGVVVYAGPHTARFQDCFRIQSDCNKQVGKRNRTRICRSPI